MSDKTPDFHVYTVVERKRQERARWLRVGGGWENKDGSINVALDALPVNGRLNIRAADEDGAEDAPDEGA